MVDWAIEHVGWVIVGVCAVVLVAMLSGFWVDYKNTQRLMDACLADGHKEYECVGLIQRNNSGGVLPMIVPIH